MPLAINSYEDLAALDDEPGLLNLAWTLDERACLAIDLPALTASELESEAREGLPNVQRYFVDDPYGEAALGPALAAFFARAEWTPAVVSGAGVISLLHALARLTSAGSVHVVGDCYPDFPFWVEQAGGRCVPALEDASLVFLERPSLIGDRLSSLAEVRTLCEAAATSGSPVLIDESNANYCPPGFSAVNLLPDLDNLLVLRGLSKGYGLGGVRLGLCVMSDGLRDRVRSTVPPLLASSLSLRIGARILELGDIGAPLRQRIRSCKDETLRLLADAGTTGIVRSSDCLPYVLLADWADAAARLERAGILGKAHVVWSGAESGPQRFYRLSVPLTVPRMQALREKLRPVPPGLHDA